MMNMKLMNYKEIYDAAPKDVFRFLDKEVKDICKGWRTNLNDPDRKILLHLEKHSNLLNYFLVFYVWKNIEFKNRKSLALQLCHHLKIYVALTSYRSTDTDIENFDYYAPFVFRIERISRGEPTSMIHPQLIRRLGNVIRDFPFQDMLAKLSEAEKHLTKPLDKHDLADAKNLLFGYAPALLSFFILESGKGLFGDKLSFSKGIIDSLNFYMNHYPLTKSMKADEVHRLIGNIISLNIKENTVISA